MKNRIDSISLFLTENYEILYHQNLHDLNFLVTKTIIQISFVRFL